MKINIDIGSVFLGTVNSFKITEEGELDHLEDINTILTASKHLFKETNLKLQDSKFDLTLYFNESYASFKSIFNSMAYLDFKAAISKIFPVLEEQFPLLEKKVLIQEELTYNLHELEEYERFGFFGSKEYIDLIKERIVDLEKQGPLHH